MSDPTEAEIAEERRLKHLMFCIDRYLGSEVLKDACWREGKYRLRLVTGDIYEFTRAYWQSEGWIRLNLIPEGAVDMRCASIVWVQDMNKIHPVYPKFP